MGMARGIGVDSPRAALQVGVARGFSRQCARVSMIPPGLLRPGAGVQVLWVTVAFMTGCPPGRARSRWCDAWSVPWGPVPPPWWFGPSAPGGHASVAAFFASLPRRPDRPSLAPGCGGHGGAVSLACAPLSIPSPPASPGGGGSAVVPASGSCWGIRFPCSSTPRSGISSIATCRRT